MMTTSLSHNPGEMEKSCTGAEGHAATLGSRGQRKGTQSENEFIFSVSRWIVVERTK
jgi:hypothetical protein